MPMEKSDFHLSCGCHNPVADLLIAQAAKTLPDVEPRDTYSAPKTAYIFTVSENATIRPVTGGDAGVKVDALGIVGDKVVAAGLRKDVEKTVKSRVQEMERKENLEIPVISHELTGTQTLIPGMIESHVHIVISAIVETFNDYSPFGAYSLTSPEQPTERGKQELRPDYDMDILFQKLKQDVKMYAKKSDWWLLGMGVDTSLLGKRPSNTTLLNCIDNKQLDANVSETTPILLISASEHSAYCNTPALKAIWYRAVDTGNQKLLDRYENSVTCFTEKTQGVLQEAQELLSALDSIGEEQSKAVLSELNDRIAHFLSTALKRGATMVYDAGMRKPMYKALVNFLTTSAQEGKRIPNRIGMAHMAEGPTDLKGLPPFALPRENPGSDRLTSIDLYYGSVKMISDGSNQGLTGYQSAPYCCPPQDNYGAFNFSDEDAPPSTPPQAKPPKTFVDMVGKIHCLGWPAMIHANGDQAIQYTLDAYEKVAAAHPCSVKDSRNRIEHCSLMSKDDIPRLKEADISPSFLIGHVGYWGWAFDDYIFNCPDKDKNKARESLDLCRSTADGGVPFTLHSDCSVSPLGPLRMMEQAVTRKMEGSPEAKRGKDAVVADIPVLNAEECLTPAQALRAVTYDAAWQCHADHLVGSLEESKLADFVILEQDPLAMERAEDAYMKMRYIQVSQVWIGGTNIDLSDPA